jgi:hypothetical protein
LGEERKMNERMMKNGDESQSNGKMKRVDERAGNKMGEERRGGRGEGMLHRKSSH